VYVVDIHITGFLSCKALLEKVRPQPKDPCKKSVTDYSDRNTKISEAVVAKSGARGASKLAKHGQAVYPIDVSCPACGRSLKGEMWERVVITSSRVAMHAGDCHRQMIGRGQRADDARRVELRDRIQSGGIHVHAGAIEAMRAAR
jgi:hypothetical protein